MVETGLIRHVAKDSQCICRGEVGSRCSCGRSKHEFNWVEASANKTLPFAGHGAGNDLTTRRCQVFNGEIESRLDCPSERRGQAGISPILEGNQCLGNLVTIGCARPSVYLTAPYRSWFDKQRSLAVLADRARRSPAEGAGAGQHEVEQLLKSDQHLEIL